MINIQAVVEFLEEVAPLDLAAAWDNVGLLLGDPRAEAKRIMTCLTLTQDIVEEAVAERASLIVSHHPLPFRPLKTITIETYDGRRLWRLAREGIAVYSPHTAYDSAAGGINQALAEGLGLREIVPLAEIPMSADARVGTGRRGSLREPMTLAEFAARVKKFLKLDAVTVSGSDDKPIRNVGIGCGSAGDLIPLASQAGCNCFVTGEASFHTTLEALESWNSTALVLVGHYASERFGVERLATVLQREFADLTVWAARREHDPLRIV